MVGAFDDWMVHQVGVRTLTSVDRTGVRTYLPERPIRCWLEDRTQLVRAGDGQEVQVQTLLHTDLAYADWLTPGSEISVRGRVAQVVTRQVSDSTVGDELDGVTVGLT